MAVPPAGMAAWWQASAITGVAEGAQVLSWPDSSPNGYDATGNGGTKPSMRLGFINGQNALEFSGSNSYSSTLTSSQNVFTIVMVAAPNSLSGNRNIIGANATGGREFRYNNANRQVVVRAVLAGTATSATYAAVANQFEIVTAEWDATTQKVYVNGTLAVNAYYAPSITAGLTTLIGGGTAGMSGKIAEVIVYHSVLSVGNRAQVHTYLSDKYGIAVSDYVTGGGNIKVHNGSSFVAKPVKVWNGSAWVAKPVKRYNGSTWVTTPY